MTRLARKLWKKGKLSSNDNSKKDARVPGKQAGMSKDLCQERHPGDRQAWWQDDHGRDGDDAYGGQPVGNDQGSDTPPSPRGRQGQEDQQVGNDQGWACTHWV